MWRKASISSRRPVDLLVSVFIVLTSSHMRAGILGTVNFLPERFGEAQAHVGGRKNGVDLAYGLGAVTMGFGHWRSPWRPPTTMSALRSMRRLVGFSTRVVPASVHYIRRERGRCLTRGRRFRAGVNKLGKTEPETGRRGAEVAWNPVGLGGPTAVGSNGETNRDAKFFERLRRRAGRCRQPTGTQISGGKGFGSSSATLQETKTPACARDDCCLLYTSPSPRDGLLSRMP